MNLLQHKKNIGQSYSLFKQFYRDFLRQDLDKIDDIYEEQAIYRDPLKEIRGLSNIHEYRSHACRRFYECRLEYLDECLNAESAYLKWNMHFKFKKNNKPHTLRGVTQLIFTDKIVYHEDVYDIVTMFQQRLPIVVNITQACLRKLTK